MAFKKSVRQNRKTDEKNTVTPGVTGAYRVFVLVCGTDGFIAPIVVDGYGVENGIVIDSNAVTSIHGCDNAVSILLADAISVEQSGNIGVYYIDKNKAAGLLQNAGLQLPGMLFRTDGYIHSIRDSASACQAKI